MRHYFKVFVYLLVLGLAVSRSAFSLDMCPANGVMRAGNTAGFASCSSLDLSKSGTVGSSVLGATNGGTSFSTYTLGDTIYASAANTLSKLAGNTTTTKKYFTQTGNGSVSAAPGWNPIAQADLPTIALTSDVTGSASAGSIATTIAAIQGKAVNNTTGTINVVFSNSPTFSGSPVFSLGSAGAAVFTNATTGLGGASIIATNVATGTTGDGAPAIQVQKTSTTNTSSQVFQLFTINNGATNSGTITAAGASAAQFTTASDRRLKQGIEDLEPQLENIARLRPVEFEYRDKLHFGAGRQIGFIAQEVRAVYPDSVHKQANGMLHVTGWDRTTARLVKALQELKAQNDELRAEFEAYRAQHP